MEYNIVRSQGRRQTEMLHLHLEHIYIEMGQELSTVRGRSLNARWRKIVAKCIYGKYLLKPTEFIMN